VAFKVRADEQGLPPNTVSLPSPSDRNQEPAKNWTEQTTQATTGTMLLRVAREVRRKVRARMGDVQRSLFEDLNFDDRGKEALAKRDAEAKLLRGADAELERGEPEPPTKPKLGKLIKLPERRPTGSLKLEQNLGCELPVCVSNRRDVKGEAIEFTTDAGLTWRLNRTTDSLLPAPEHYRHWLWFLDRCKKAGDAGADRAPRIELNPPELYRLFGGARTGRWYNVLDDSFTRFSKMVISVGTALHANGVDNEYKANLGTLCHYASWRTKKPHPHQETFEFQRGWVAPGELLWDSMESGYLLSVPLEPIIHLQTYVAQRLYTYLCKHCRPGCEYTVSLRKLLPKIPMTQPLKEAKRMLTPHHKALVDIGFLVSMPQYVGRGEDRMVVYRRSRKLPQLT